MDKRLIKTQHAIYDAFKNVLNEKEYNKITVEDILQKSGVSRSTFYSHFKTIDEVLESVINHIFEHVFSHSLTVEKTHDFSKSDFFDYTHLLTHILYHLHDEMDLIGAILSNTTKDKFFNTIRLKITPFIKAFVHSTGLVKNDIPEELTIAKVRETFILVISYWFENNCKETPEKVTNYFFLLNK